MDISLAERSLKTLSIPDKTTIGKDSRTTRTRICEHTKDEWHCFDSSKLLLPPPHDFPFIFYLLLLLINIGHVLFVQILHLWFSPSHAKASFKRRSIYYGRQLDLGPRTVERSTIWWTGPTGLHLIHWWDAISYDIYLH